jgi:hypothetical protein
VGWNPISFTRIAAILARTTFANVAGIRIVDLPADPSHVRSCLLMFYNMTSDHRVAGSSPAGCKSSLRADLLAIMRARNQTTKSVVIRLLSVFAVQHADRELICADNAGHFRLDAISLLSDVEGHLHF